MAKTHAYGLSIEPYNCCQYSYAATFCNEALTFDSNELYDNLLSNLDFFKKLDMPSIYIQGVINYYNNILKIPYIFFKAFRLYPQQDFLAFSFHSANIKCFVKMSWEQPIMSFGNADVYLLTKTHTHRSPIARYTCWQHSYATNFSNETLWFYIWQRQMVWFF